MSEIVSQKYFVKYIIEKNPKFNLHGLNANHDETTKDSVVDDYINSQEGIVISEFIEYIDPKKTANQAWHELQKAVMACNNNNATLVINEIGNLTNNYSFSEIIIDAHVDFYCCDLNFLDRENLKVIRQHAQIQRQLHGELIRAGLKQTNAKSGNPNAAEVISKVNKPKIDTAIVFACLLQPIIASYKRKGYSQRQMVKTLNEEGFSAPEGGKWVLSQLQKVLDRVRLNEVSFDNRDIITELRNNNLSDEEIAIELNQKGISSPKRGLWDQANVKKLINRIDQIQDIELINQFVLDLIPIIHSYRKQGESAIEMMRQFDRVGLVIKNKHEEQQEASA